MRNIDAGNGFFGFEIKYGNIEWKTDEKIYKIFLVANEAITAARMFFIMSSSQALYSIHKKWFSYLVETGKISSIQEAPESEEEQIALVQKWTSRFIG